MDIYLYPCTSTFLVNVNMCTHGNEIVLDCRIIQCTAECKATFTPDARPTPAHSRPFFYGLVGYDREKNYPL